MMVVNKKIIILLQIYFLLLNSLSLLYAIAKSQDNGFMVTIPSQTYGVYDNSPYPLKIQINPQNKPVKYFVTNLPEGAKFYKKGLLVWKPKCNQDGYYNIKILVEFKDKVSLMNIRIIVNDGC